MMIISKSVTSIDNFYSERNTLVKIKVKLLVMLVKRSIVMLTSIRLNLESVKRIRLCSMMTSGLIFNLLLMLSIMSKLDNMLMDSVFGSKNHSLKVELLELSVTLK